MNELTSQERYLRIFDHLEADRIPVTESPWQSTLARWHSEGMPKDCSYEEFTGLDTISVINVDNSPQYPVTIEEETSEHKIHWNAWGAKMKDWK